VNAIPADLADLAVPVADLVPYRSNPRVGNLDTIVESLQVNGQYRPIVVNRRTNEVLAGNHTLKAALVLGWDRIAATFVDVDDEQAARIVLVDNRANDLAGYDDSALVALLEELGPGHLEGTGFSDGDLAALLAGVIDEPPALTDEDDAPALPKVQPVSKVGDVWLLGPSVLLVGDSTDSALVLDALGGQLADCVWTDPPYGVSYVGGTADALTIENDGKDDLPDLLPAAFRTAVACAKPGAPVYVAHADTERIIFEESMRAAGMLVRQNLVWVKNGLVLGRADYQYRHEPILTAETPPAEAEEDAEGVTHGPLLYGFTGGGEGRLGRGGPRWFGDNKQTTVFEVPKPKRNGDHPTMKPVELIGRMLANSLPPGGLVLDLFGGSGSTLIAAHHHRSRATLVELDPRYADVICRRYQEHTGTVPVLRDTGQPHDFVTAG
jgi:site-specific DNA-methyltransferase (adenine-specific)